MLNLLFKCEIQSCCFISLIYAFLQRSILDKLFYTTKCYKAHIKKLLFWIDINVTWAILLEQYYLISTNLYSFKSCDTVQLIIPPTLVTKLKYY